MDTIELQEAPSEQPHSGGRGRADVAAVDDLRREIDSFYRQMRLFPQMEGPEIFMELAGMSARCSEIRCRIVRTTSRALNTFRTKELDPLIDELDRQFRTWSRLATVRAQEWDMAGKAV